MVSGSRRVECGTSIDQLNGDKLVCRFGRASKKIWWHGEVSKGLAVTALQVLAEMNSNLLLVSDVKGPYFFGLHTRNIVQR